MSPADSVAVGADPLHAEGATLDERVAVLEERTRPKPKSVLDRIKDWGGVASLVIALAYSFPLGLWNQFIEPEKRRAAEEIATLRSAVEQSTILLADSAKALAGISNSFLYDVVGRAFNTRLYVLMAKHRDAFLRHKGDFSAPEAMVIGYNFQTTNQTEAALTFFQQAQALAGADVITEMEAMRMRGKTLFMPGPHQDRAMARDIFKNAAARLAGQTNYQSISSYITLTADWALLELMDGDWACGDTQLAIARKTYDGFAPFMNDAGHFGRMIDEKVRSLAPRPGQPRQGC